MALDWTGAHSVKFGRIRWSHFFQLVSGISPFGLLAAVCSPAIPPIPGHLGESRNSWAIGEINRPFGFRCRKYDGPSTGSVVSGPRMCQVGGLSKMLFSAISRCLIFGSISEVQRIHTTNMLPSEDNVLVWGVDLKYDMSFRWNQWLAKIIHFKRSKNETTLVRELCIGSILNPSAFACFCSWPWSGPTFALYEETATGALLSGYAM